MTERRLLYMGDDYTHPEEQDLTSDTFTFYGVTVGTGGLSMGGDILMDGNEVTGLPTTPSGPTAATSKLYVDSLIDGSSLPFKDGVKAVAETNQTLSGLPTNIDGVTVWAAGTRLLLTGQSDSRENGIWIVQTGAWTRPSDFSTGVDASGTFCFVDQGTTQADTGWLCTTNAGSDVVGTDALTFIQFNASSGASSDLGRLLITTWGGAVYDNSGELTIKESP